MKIKVGKHRCEIIKSPVNEKEVNVTEIEFEFDEAITNEFVKEAYFTYGKNSYKEIIVNNKCSIPGEVIETKGQVEVGVVAYLADNELIRYNPSPVYFNTLVGSLKDNPKNSEPITPSEMEQYEQALQDGLSDVSEALVDMRELMQEADTLDIDASKSGDTATIEITRKDGTIKTVEITDGVDGQDGAQGPEGKQGPPGENGKDGQDGAQGPAGPTGNGITGVNKTSTSGLVDTYTISYTNGNTSTFDITNGRNGTNGRDGYKQYTAGNGIDITNDVISATGGSGGNSVKFLGDIHNYSTQQDALDLNQLSAGCYILTGVDSDWYVKATFMGQTIYGSYYIPDLALGMLMLVIYEQVNENTEEGAQIGVFNYLETNYYSMYSLLAEMHIFQDGISMGGGISYDYPMLDIALGNVTGFDDTKVQYLKHDDSGNIEWGDDGVSSALGGSY